jgi:hypothetical protein
MVMFSLLTNPPLSLSLQLTKLERKLEPHNMVMFSLLTNPPFLSHSNSQS